MCGSQRNIYLCISIYVWEKRIEKNSVNEHLHAYHDDPANGQMKSTKETRKKNEKIDNHQRTTSTELYNKRLKEEKKTSSGGKKKENRRRADSLKMRSKKQTRNNFRIFSVFPFSLYCIRAQTTYIGVSVLLSQCSNEYFVVRKGIEPLSKDKQL